MSLLIEIKLNEKFAKISTYDKGINGEWNIVLDPRTQDEDPSTRVIVEVYGLAKKVNNKLIPVMWSVALESLIHLEDEETRQVSGLLDSTIVVAEVDEDIIDSLYSWNLVNCFTENCTG